MEQSSLIELIRTLNSTEKDHVRQFAALPFFNNGKMRAHVGPLLELCLSHSWDSASQPLDKEFLSNTLFSEAYVNGRKLEKVMVEAHKIVRAFLLVQNYYREDNDFAQNFDFSEIVRSRNLETRFRHMLAKIQRSQADSPWKNEQYYHRQFVLEYAIFEHECLHNQARGDLNIPEALRALDEHYYINRLNLLNHFLLQQKVANVIVPDSVETAISETSVLGRYLETSATIKINTEIFFLLKKSPPEPSDVRLLFDLLKIHEEGLDQDSLRKFYTYLRNVCVLIANVFFDDEEIRHTLFDLYRDNLTRGYLHFEGKLHPNTYLAVSTAAVRVNQYEWGLDFIEQFKDQIIGENEHQDIYRFNMALYLFGVGRYDECLTYIPSTSPFIDYLFRGKRLELKAYYEIDSDLLPYKLDAFKMFLSRTSQKLLSESQNQLNLDFANLLYQLIHSIPGDPKRANRIIERIQAKKSTAEWRWLLEKAEALR